MNKRSVKILSLGLTAVVALATVVAVTASRRGDRVELDPASTTSCLALSVTPPDPTSAGKFEAIVVTLADCVTPTPPGSTGSCVLELWRDGERVNYLKPPNRVFPPDNQSWTEEGCEVLRPHPYRLPRVEAGRRYTLCRTVTLQGPERVCAPLAVR